MAAKTSAWHALGMPPLSFFLRLAINKRSGQFLKEKKQMNAPFTTINTMVIKLFIETSNAATRMAYKLLQLTHKSINLYIGELV